MEAQLRSNICRLESGREEREGDTTKRKKRKEKKKKRSGMSLLPCFTTCSPTPIATASATWPSSSSSIKTKSVQLISTSKSSFHGLRIQSARPLRVSSSSSPSPATPVKMMAKREEEMKGIRAKSTKEINEEVVDLKADLFLLRLQKSPRNDIKSSEFRRMRKRIARMLTIKREREIEEGINKRLSRKLDRQWRRSVVVRPPPSMRNKEEEKQAAEAEKSS